MVIKEEILLHGVFELKIVGVLFVSDFLGLVLEQLFCWGHWALVRNVLAALVVINDRASESARRRVVMLLLVLNFSLPSLYLNVLLVEVKHFLIPV